MGDYNSQFDGSIPERYDRFLGPTLFAPFAADLAARLDVAPHANLLELACGTGVLTRAICERIPASVHFTATDLNEPMLDVAKAKLADRPEIVWRIADAANLPFDSESFDGVVCQFGLMFVPDKAAALGEVRRVLRPGGAFLFNVWDRIEANRLAWITHQTVLRLFPEDPPMFYQVPFSLYDTDALAAMLGEAGFGDLDVTAVSKVGESPSAGEVAEGLVLGNPLVTALRERGTDVDAVVRDVADAVAADCGTAPVRAPMRAFVVRASRNPVA